MKFFPNLNSFYVALPYNDVVNDKTTKKEAARIIPWFKQSFKKEGISVCRDRWIAIRHGNRICYAQWSDCGPVGTDDASYVFGSARPANAGNDNAGMSVSPAVRDYLSFVNGGNCDWRFVDVEEVPEGPWRVYGSNNPFAQRNPETEGNSKQRDEYLKKNSPDKKPKS